MKFAKENLPIIIFVVLCLVFYTSLLFLFDHTANVYDLDQHTNNDRFFSLDDVYYAKEIYSLTLENTARIVKHPLFMVFGNIFMRCEKFFFRETDLRTHYILIIFLQILVQLTAVFYLYGILNEFYKLEKKYIFLILCIYSFSTSAILFTLIAESYIFSGTFLIMSYYYLLKKNLPASVILGVVVAGITITNLAIWLIMAVLLLDGIKRKVLTAAFTLVLFVLLVTFLPVGKTFFENFFHVFQNSPKNFSDAFDRYEACIRIIYAIFGTTVFYVNTVNLSPFGEYPGKAISFIPSSNIFTLFFIAVWIGMVLFPVFRAHSRRLLLAPLAILTYNILLHGVKQYGLKEAFLYSLHHFFAQLLIVSSIFLVNDRKIKQIAFIAMLAFFIGEIVVNLKGYCQFYNYVCGLYR